MGTQKEYLYAWAVGVASVPHAPLRPSAPPLGPQEPHKSLLAHTGRGEPGCSLRPGFCPSSLLSHIFSWEGVSSQNSKQQIEGKPFLFRFPCNLLWFLWSQPYTWLVFPNHIRSKGSGAVPSHRQHLYAHSGHLHFPTSRLCGTTFLTCTIPVVSPPRILMLSLLQDTSIDVYWDKSILSSPFQHNTALQIKHALCQAILLRNLLVKLQV